MEPAGNAREVAVADTTVVEGSAWWHCPSCGFDAIA